MFLKAGTTHVRSLCFILSFKNLNRSSESQMEAKKVHLAGSQMSLLALAWFYFHYFHVYLSPKCLKIDQEALMAFGSFSHFHLSVFHIHTRSHQSVEKGLFSLHHEKNPTRATNCSRVLLVTLVHHI